jgi:hypothetical protein
VCSCYDTFVARCNHLSLFYAILIVFVSSLGCALIYSDRQFRISGSSHSHPVFLIPDSSEVRHLLAEEDVREEDVSHFWREKHTKEEVRKRIQDITKNPEQYPVGRSEFLQAMGRIPGVYVSGSYCRIIERSKSTCGQNSIETAPFVMVRITTGASRGTQGWVCGTGVKQLFP